MTKFSRYLALAFLLVPLCLNAQDAPPIEEDEEDEIDYSTLIQSQKNKAFCSSRVLRQSPQKLVSVGYDFQSAHTLTPEGFSIFPEKDFNINHARGLRMGVNYPVFSKNYFLLNLGMNYAETVYDFATAPTAADNPLPRALAGNGLRALGFTATGFKPLNIKHFMIIQIGATLNGDYTLSAMQDMSYMRYTGAAIYGIKPNDRKMWGIGLSRTYLGGSLNYVPVYYLMYSSENKKWGIEMLLPARFNYRRNLNSKNLLLLGYEVEGNTFRLNNDDNRYPPQINNFELRRAELRIRATWEYAVTSQIWLSTQLGYRYNWSFEVDRGDFFRPFFDNTPYLFENRLGNPLYFQISINWVSP